MSELFIDMKYTPSQVKMMNPLVLAYIGDAVYELFVRTEMIGLHDQYTVHKLHNEVVGFVKASAQFETMKTIEQELTEEELYIYKRGRNAKSAVPKSAEVSEYRVATGFEAVLGYLYLLGESERLKTILNKIIELREKNK